MEDETMSVHLKQEALKVADYIARERGNEKMSGFKVDQLACEDLDETSFWSIMEDETLHAHLKQEAYKVADLIAQESGKLQLCPLASPEKREDHIFKLLRSDDWQKKIDGLTCIQDLPKNYPDALKTKFRKVCVNVMDEVGNLRSTVYSLAMAALDHLQRTMVEGTGSTLILKESKSNTSIQQQDNVPLNTKVQNCSAGLDDLPSPMDPYRRQEPHRILPDCCKRSTYGCCSGHDAPQNISTHSAFHAYACWRDS